MTFAEILTAIGLAFTGGGLMYAAQQLRASRKIARIEFVLRIYEMMQQYNDVHVRLVEKGSWSGDAGPSTEEEWARVDRYMGLFEPIQMLLEDGLVGIKMVDTLYGHRVLALVRNPVIARRNLRERSYRWGRFISLWEALKRQKCFSSIEKNELQPYAKSVIQSR